jgi:hypothetical protein
MLAGTSAWAKEPKRNHPPRRESAPHNPQPHFPKPGRNSGIAPPSPTKSDSRVNDPKVSEPKITEPKVTEPNPSGLAGDSKSANDAKATHTGEPKLGTAEAAKPRPGEGLARLKDMNPTDQQKVLNNDPEFQKLPPEQKQKLRQRLEEFNKLPAAQKQQLIDRVKAWERFSPEQKEQARVLQQRMQTVPEDRQKMMRTALRSLRQMDPEERERVMSSDRFKSMFNDNERDIMHGITGLPIGNQQADAAQPAPQTQPK